MLAKSTLMRLLIAAGFLLIANILFAQKTVSGPVGPGPGKTGQRDGGYGGGVCSHGKRTRRLCQRPKGPYLPQKQGCG